MAAALLDTNAISDLMRDHTQVTARATSHTDPLVTSVIVWGGIRYGLHRMPAGRKRNDLEQRASRIQIALPGEPITLQIAEGYGRLKASLENQGITLQDNDLWIAATALNLQAILVTRDHVFGRIPGLNPEDWSL
jgi:predicted nucleic acid-binding protein